MPKTAKEYPVSTNIDDPITENFASKLQSVSILSFLKRLARMDDELSILSPECPGQFSVLEREVAEPLRQDNNPLPYRNLREEMLDQVGGGFHHALGVTGEAYTSPFARIGDQKVLAALIATSTSKTMCKYPALQKLSQIPLYMLGDGVKNWMASRVSSSHVSR